ncbi:glutathione S-transferase T1-like protein, partial [Tanacetum coccineum]
HAILIYLSCAFSDIASHFEGVTFWLEDGRFLVGSSQPSIADISMACEIMQLELLSKKDRDRILSPYKKVV